MKTAPVRTDYTPEETQQFESNRVARKLAAQLTAEYLQGRVVVKPSYLAPVAITRAMDRLRTELTWTPGHTGLAQTNRNTAAEAQRLANRKAAKRRAARLRRKVAEARTRSTAGRGGLRVAA